jgi:magnesium transporter
MPELSQPWGYPVALIAMVVSVMLPLAWFKRKGWL